MKFSYRGLGSSCLPVPVPIPVPFPLLHPPFLLTSPLSDSVSLHILALASVELNVWTDQACLELIVIDPCVTDYHNLDRGTSVYTLSNL